MTGGLTIAAAIAAGAVSIILLLKWIMRVSEARGRFGQSGVGVGVGIDGAGTGGWAGGSGDCGVGGDGGGSCGGD
ncbi:MAG: hypothetical protein QOD42_2408 [Sphingomonadales bacterium]|jgi:hypothetical protein|nr:hypothetical protein [Sphingomonadales bacterium]